MSNPRVTLDLTGRSESDGLLGKSRRRYSGDWVDEAEPVAKSSFYRNPHYLSESAFRTLTEGIAETLTKPSSYDNLRLRTRSETGLDSADHTVSVPHLLYNSINYNNVFVCREDEYCTARCHISLHMVCKIAKGPFGT
jgi:hypothetical protein